MPRIYAIGEGYVVQIGTFGRATSSTPAIVPAHVADEFRGRPDLRIEDGDALPPPDAVDNGDKAAIETEDEE